MFVCYNEKKGFMVSMLSLFGYMILKYGVSSLLNTVQLSYSYLVIHHLISIMVASHCVCVCARARMHACGGGGGEKHMPCHV